MILALPIFGIIAAIEEEISAWRLVKSWDNRKNEKSLSDIIHKYEQKK